jgi:hypothetical protein
MAAFHLSLELEEALLVLERDGVERRGIMVVPLYTGPEGDSGGWKSDWVQASFESGMALGTASAVVGISQGFIREWGPLIWGLITALSGFAIGFGLCALFHYRLWRRLTPGRHPEAMIIVRCNPEEVDRLRTVLWRHGALSVGSVAKDE